LQHRRVLRDAVQHRAEVAERLAPQQRVLGGHRLRERHLVLPGREVAVPEQRHPLGERRRRHDHLVEPCRA